MNMTNHALEKANPALSTGIGRRYEREDIWRKIDAEIARQALGALRIGQALKELQGTFECSSDFMAHVRDARGWESSSVYNYLLVADRFSDREADLEAIGPRLPASALYKLCSKRVPESVFETILEGAKKHQITLRQVDTLLAYGRIQQELQELDGGMMPRVILDAQKELPAHLRPLPSLLELMTLYSSKGLVKPEGEGFRFDRDGEQIVFDDIATADQAWRMVWERKPDYQHQAIARHDRVKFRAIDLPCDDAGNPICSEGDYCEVTGLKLWKIRVEFDGVEGWGYRCGVVDVVRPEPTEFQTMAQVDPFFREEQVCESAEEQARSVLGDRPVWLSVCSIVRRFVDGVPQLGAVETLDKDGSGCTISWATDMQHYTWTELQSAHIVCITPHVNAIRQALGELGQQLLLDVVAFAIDEQQELEDYCNA